MYGFTVIFRCQKLFEFNFVVVVLNTFFLFLSLTLANHLKIYPIINTEFFYPLDHSPATTVQPAYGLFQETKNDYVVHVNPNQKYEDSLNQATFYHSTTVSPPIQVF